MYTADVRKSKHKQYLDEWVKLYNSGVTATEIAKRYNVHSSNVYWNLHSIGVNLRSKSEVKLNEKHPLWKGDGVGYYALHTWVKRRLRKPELCEICKIQKPLDLANISQEYKRDITDWEWLCRRCHMVKDGRLNKLHNI